MLSRLNLHWFGRSAADAPTLVLLHGITDSGRCWPDVIERWGPKYRIVAIDALGHGLSDRFRDDEVAGEGLDAAAGALDALVLTTTEAVGSVSGPVVLIGHSMGGATAAVVAANRPDLLRGVVLEEPAWQEPSTERWARRGPAWVASARDDREDRREQSSGNWRIRRICGRPQRSRPGWMPMLGSTIGSSGSGGPSPPVPGAKSCLNSKFPRSS